MVDTSRKLYETIVDSDGILLLNKKHIGEGLEYKYLQVTTARYPSGYRKHTYEEVDKLKNNPTENLYAKN